jgi:hypothetical protein
MRITNEASCRFLAELINEQSDGYQARVEVRGWARRLFFAPCDGETAV